MTSEESPTLVAELTPAGRAAVAVVVVEGPRALAAIRESFVPATPWADGAPAIGRVMLGKWGGTAGEDVLVCRRGENRFEAHCHGGAAAVRSIVERLAHAGCEVISWQEWSRRSEPDAIRGAARALLADAVTQRAAAVLLDQLNGALTTALMTIRASLVNRELQHARARVEAILKHRDVGLHLVTPWRVILAGAPNVGKSSLINAIAGFQRSIVSPRPGTTRDVVTVTTAIDGWSAQLADTAGLRDTRDEIESAGVALASAALDEADLAILVSDATMAGDAAVEIGSRLRESVRIIRVVNKIDLLRTTVAEGGMEQTASDLAGCGAQRVSALTGEGVPELIVAIGRALAPKAPPAGAAVAFTAEQVSHLEAARSAILIGDAASAEAAVTALLS
jgi:tRNA modification GTPase